MPIKPEEIESSMIIGGNLVDAKPRPTKRRFPGKTKRKVDLSIQTWASLARHYHVTLREEDNPFVCRCKGDRQFPHEIPHEHSFWDDGESGRGRCLMGRFGSYAEAQVWIRKTFTEEFGKKTHRLVDSAVDRNIRWFYREGD